MAVVNMTECIARLRRRIGDSETPFSFADNVLTGYIEDAVSEVEIEYPRGIETVSGLFTQDIESRDATLFAIKAHYLFTLRTKEKSDRDNFRMVKGRLTLDNTNQSKDHEETLKLIDQDYKRTLLFIRNKGSTLQGIRME